VTNGALTEDLKPAVEDLPPGTTEDFIRDLALKCGPFHYTTNENNTGCYRIKMFYTNRKERMDVSLLALLLMSYRPS
jgi:hypothetical protein